MHMPLFLAQGLKSIEIICVSPLGQETFNKLVVLWFFLDLIYLYPMPSLNSICVCTVRWWWNYFSLWSRFLQLYHLVQRWWWWNYFSLWSRSLQLYHLEKGQSLFSLWSSSLQRYHLEKGERLLMNMNTPFKKRLCRKSYWFY